MQLPVSPYYYDAQSGRPRHREYKGVVLRGLHPLLRAAFFPDYRYASTPPSRDSDRPKPRRNTPREGRELGRRVDRELTEAFVVGGDIASQWHAHTKHILEALRRLDYCIVGTQVGVGCQVLRAYHAIDLVLVHRQATTPMGVVLAEVKCCESHYYKKAGRDRHGAAQRLHAPYEDKSNAPFHQHQLQMGWSGELWRATFPGVRVDGHLLIRAHSDGVDVERLQGWVADGRRQGLRRLLEVRREPSIMSYAPVRRSRATDSWRRRRRYSPLEGRGRRAATRRGAA